MCKLTPDISFLEGEDGEIEAAYLLNITSAITFVSSELKGTNGILQSILLAKGEPKAFSILETLSEIS